MKSIKLSPSVAAGVLFATLSASAFAASNAPRIADARGVNQWEETSQVKSSTTRAEIRNDLNRAHADGTHERAQYIEFKNSGRDNIGTDEQVRSRLFRPVTKMLKPGDIYYGG